MGEIVSASCSTCGFDKLAEIGGGMEDHETHSYFPYLCEVCGMVSANIAEQIVVCPVDPQHRIARYGGSVSQRVAEEPAGPAPERRATTLLERLGLRKRAVAQPAPRFDVPAVCRWDDHEILFQAYECPSCHAQSLYFEDTGNFFD